MQVDFCSVHDGSHDEIEKACPDDQEESGAGFSLMDQEESNNCRKEINAVNGNSDRLFKDEKYGSVGCHYGSNQKSNQIGYYCCYAYEF